MMRGSSSFWIIFAFKNAVLTSTVRASHVLTSTAHHPVTLPIDVRFYLPRATMMDQLPLVVELDEFGS